MNHFLNKKIIPSIKVVSKNDPNNIYISFDKSDTYIIMIRKYVTTILQSNVTPEYLMEYICDIMINIDEEIEIVTNIGPGITNINHLDPSAFKHELLKTMKSFIYIMYIYQ